MKQILSAGLVLLVVLLAGCDRQKTDGDENAAPLVVRMAIPMQPSSGLALIAREKGFFARRGLSVTYSEYPSGKRALQNGLLAGNADVAFSADVPIVAAAMAGESFRVVANTFHASNINRVIARKDHGIQFFKDMKGKKIATQQDSAVHFFLSLLLFDNGLSANDIQLSFMKAEELVPALVSGSIDAFSMREPYIAEAKARLGENAVIFSAPGLYQQFDSALVTTQLLKQQPQVVDRLLLALRDAEAYFINHPDEAINLGARTLGIHEEELRVLWVKHSLLLTLDQAYLLMLEDISRWMINSKLTDSSVLPDYLSFIETGPIDRLDSSRISLIR